MFLRCFFTIQIVLCILKMDNSTIEKDAIEANLIKETRTLHRITHYALGDPPKWIVHAAAIFVQILFGIGNCIGKVALISIPPLIFAFYREFFAGIILLLVCVRTTKYSIFILCSFSQSRDLCRKKILYGCFW